MLNRFRRFIRDSFTRTDYVLDDEQPPVGVQPRTCRRSRNRSRIYRQVVVSPSERFVGVMIIIITSLVGLILLDAYCVATSGTVNNELTGAISLY